MRWVDSHCNFESDQLKDRVPELLDQARGVGIEHIVNICSKVIDFPKIIDVANAHDMVSATIGTHPHHSGEESEVPVTTDDLVRIAQENDKVIAIGESGLDFHYNHSEPDAQRLSFRKHIRACLETDLPMVIHARTADEEIQSIIEEEAPNGQLKGILHCYASGAGLAQWGIDYGLYVSFSGILTFKNAQDIRDIARDIVPLERLLIETDAPYLAPTPMRGRVCEPSLLPHTGQVLATLKNVGLSEIADHTTRNFYDLFSKRLSNPDG